MHCLPNELECEMEMQVDVNVEMEMEMELWLPRCKTNHICMLLRAYT